MESRLIRVDPANVVPFTQIESVHVLRGVPENDIWTKPARGKVDEFLVAASGDCTIVVQEGMVTREFVLNRPSVGLLLAAGARRTLRDLSAACVLTIVRERQTTEGIPFVTGS